MFFDAVIKIFCGLIPGPENKQFFFMNQGFEMYDFFDGELLTDGEVS